MAVDSVTSTSPAIAERESDVKSIKLSSGGQTIDQNQILHNSHSATTAALVAAAAAAGNGPGSQHSIDAILGLRAAEKNRQQQLAAAGVAGLHGGPISSGHLHLLHSLHNHHHHHPHHHYLNFSQFAAMNNNNNHETKGDSKRHYGSLSDEGAVSSEEGRVNTNSNHQNDVGHGESSGTMNLSNYDYMSSASRGAGSDSSEESRRGIKRAIKELNTSDLSAGEKELMRINLQSVTIYTGPCIIHFKHDHTTIILHSY